MSKITTTVSDLSGRTVTGAEPDSKNAVKVTVSGKNRELDLTPEESAAFAAFTETGNPDALRALFAAPVAAPAPTNPGRKPSAGSKSANPENKAIREWVATPEGRKALDIEPDAEISTRGRLPQEWADAYHAANPAA